MGAAVVLEPDLTTVQVAQVLGCSRQKVTDLLAAGELRGYQITAGGPWRIRPEDLAAYRQALVDAAAERAAARRSGRVDTQAVATVVGLVRSGQIDVPCRSESARRRRSRSYLGGRS